MNAPQPPSLHTERRLDPHGCSFPAHVPHPLHHHLEAPVGGRRDLRVGGVGGGGLVAEGLVCLSTSPSQSWSAVCSTRQGLGDAETRRGRPAYMSTDCVDGRMRLRWSLAVPNGLAWAHGHRNGRVSHRSPQERRVCGGYARRVLGETRDLCGGGDPRDVSVFPWALERRMACRASAGSVQGVNEGVTGSVSEGQ